MPSLPQPQPQALAGVVSDGTAAVISAAVKAVVRNSFMRLSYTLSPGTVIKEQFIGIVVPARIGRQKNEKRRAAGTRVSRGAKDCG